MYGVIVYARLFERLFEYGGDLARYAQNALAVGSVGCHGYVKDVIIEAQNGLYVLAVAAGGGEEEKAVVVCALKHIPVHAQLHARAQHAERIYAAQLALLYRHHALNGHVVLCGGVDGRALQRHGRLYACFNVVGSAAYLKYALISAVNFADVQVRSLYGLALGDFADVNSRNILAYFCQFFNFKSARKELFLKLFGGNVYIYIIFKPA